MSEILNGLSSLAFYKIVYMYELPGNVSNSVSTVSLLTCPSHELTCSLLNTCPGHGYHSNRSSSCYLPGSTRSGRHCLCWHLRNTSCQEESVYRESSQTTSLKDDPSPNFEPPPNAETKALKKDACGVNPICGLKQFK